MCTLSWVRRPTGYELGFNRDELPGRARGLPPRRELMGSTPVLLPLDPDGGGTWITVNGWGLCVALLNAPPARSDALDVSWRSRGLLVHQLADARDQDELARGLAAAELERHAGFRLVAVDRRGRPRVWYWDRTRLVEEPAELPVVSGRGDRTRLFAGRRGELDRVRTGQELTTAELERFHASHGPGSEPSAVCLHRDDASTRSFTWVKVEGVRASMRYADGPPCTARLGEPVSVELSSSGPSVADRP